MGSRRQAREAALQVLYSVDLLNRWDQEHTAFVFDHFQTPHTIRDFAEILVLGVLEQRQKIDSTITCASENWSISRMSRVDRAILRVGTYELMSHTDVPINVIINEAIEVAKRFGTGESSNFINGVLDRLASIIRQGEPLKQAVGSARR